MGVWFLKQSAATTWDVIPVRGVDGLMSNLFLPAIVTSPNLYPYTVSALSTDKVVFELAEALRLRDNQPDVFIKATGTWDSIAVRTVLNDFVQSSNPSFRAAGLSGLLKRNAVEAMTILEQVWPSITAASDRSSVLSALKQSFRGTNPQSVSKLADIASRTNSSDLRSAAIWVLKSVHTRESLPFLANLLSSSSSEEQMAAIIGISSFANGCPAQTEANVASMEYMQFKNESPYRNQQTIDHFAFGPVDDDKRAQLAAFWMDWWTINQRAIKSQ